LLYSQETLQDILEEFEVFQINGQHSKTPGWPLEIQQESKSGLRLSRRHDSVEDKVPNELPPDSCSHRRNALRHSTCQIRWLLKDVLSGPYETRHFQTVLRDEHNEEPTACKHSKDNSATELKYKDEISKDFEDYGLNYKEYIYTYTIQPSAQLQRSW
jgi:hypothetical protein